LGLPLNRIRVTYYEGAGTFGASQGRYETSLAAAVMSQIAGKPVRLQFMRQDEHGWDNFAPAQLIDLRGGIDAKGKIVGTDYTGFQIPGYTTNPTEQMVGRPLVVTTTISARHSTAMVNGVQYNIANRRVIGKVLPLRNNYFKTSSMRAPGDSQSVFAFEQLIDDLAHVAKMDPIAFRLQNLREDPEGHWNGVVNALQMISGWKPRVSASNLSDATVVSGRGIAMYPHGGGSYTGVVADVEVDKKTGKIVAKHIYVVEEAGLTINPALVENQMIGAVTQTVSRVLNEEVRFNQKGVTALDWVSYPILRFKDHPKVTPFVVQRTDQQPGGAGQSPVGSTVAAVANAFFDATGVRMREAPMTPGRVRATLRAAGVA
jgi:CO/xanthine dehydrogenase Mo-binding subunit